MLSRSAINTAIQILDVWNYILSHPDSVDLPILRALMAEHRDILSTPEFRGFSITTEALSTEEMTNRPELEVLRNQTLCVVTRIKDEWTAVVSEPNKVNLPKLRGKMAGYDDLLRDLETQQRLVIEDATIHVKIKRKRSPSPPLSHKRRSDRQQPATTYFKPTAPPLGRRDCRDEVFRGLVAMAHPQREGINHVAQPTVGELYLVCDTPPRCSLVALVLPHTNLSDVGIPGTLESLGLLKHMPTPLSFNVRKQRFEWRAGGKNGGPFACIPMFPVAYFASSSFPDSRAMGWVRADQLRAFDTSFLNPSLIPHYPLVRIFLERRMASRTHRSWIGNSPVSSGQQADKFADYKYCRQNTLPGSKPTGRDFAVVRANSRQQFMPARSAPFPYAAVPGKGNSKFNHFSGKHLTAPTIKPTAPRSTYSNDNIAYAGAQYPIDTSNYIHPPRIDTNKQAFKPPSLPSLISISKGVPGVQFGLFEWPEYEEPSERLLILLSRMSKVKGVKPLPRDFLHSDGLLHCPLCPNIEQFKHLNVFTEHLCFQH